MWVLHSFPTLSSLFATSILLPLIILPTTVLSEIVFSNPVAGRTFTGGASIDVAWRDNGAAPVSTDAATFTLDICVGSNTEIISLGAFGPQGLTFAAADGAATGVIAATLGGDGPYYFFRMTWTSANGAVVNYSDRFSMRGMAVEFTAAQLAANQAGDTNRPEAVHPQVPVPGVADANEADFAVPYTEQTGPIRYAPMQPRPGTAITAKNTKPLYPTSAYTIYTTKGGAPAAGTTVTAPRTYPLTTVVNDAAPAPMPEDAMQRFLNRWKD